MKKEVDDDEAKASSTSRGSKYGAVAGFIATWSISAAMVAAELALGFQISLFYYVAGISLGVSDTTSATYVGFSIHIVVGTILGAIVGAIIFRSRKKRVTILQRHRGTLIGIGAGIIIWLVFFVPTTTLLIEPTLHNIASLSSESQKRISTDLDPLIRNVVISAIVFHIAWGAIVGFLSVKIYEISNKSKVG
jgi:multisubunit Na+/H+ antiporter MnhC subunit